MQASLKTSQQGLTRLVFATGSWRIESLERLDRDVRELENELENSECDHVRLHLDQLTSLDTAGAWLITRLQQRLHGFGKSIELIGAGDDHASLLDRVNTGNPKPAIDRTHRPAWIRIVEHLGAVTCHVASQAYDFVSFIGSITLSLLGCLINPRKLRLAAISHHLEATGINALPIVALMSFLIGIVMAYQGSSQLTRFGAEIFTIDLLGVSVMRELGVLMTAIIVAGRSGSAFTAQIGTMQINQETDAMKVIGLNPIEHLVLPRCIALLIALPILTIVSVAMAFIGGALVVIFALDIPTIQFMRQIANAVTLPTFLAGMIKAPFFAFVIATVGCYKGLQVRGSADSVGRLTTESVVVSIFLVIVLDAVFSVTFAAMGI